MRLEDRTGIHKLLIPLPRRVAFLAAPCRTHADIEAIEVAVLDWASRVGYGDTSADLDRIRRTGFHRLAAYAFADATTHRASLFARWVLWNNAVDDACDESPDALSSERTRQLFAGFSRILHGDIPQPGATVHERALADLWNSTRAETTPQWRKRFISNIELVGQTSAREAGNRQHGRISTPDQYETLRIGTIGPYLFDLIEALYRVCLPDSLACSPVWRDLVDAGYHVIAWCNDLASFDREHANADVHNYVVVAAHAFGLDFPEAAKWVVERIENRLHDLNHAYLALPSEFDRLGLSLFQAREASKVGCVYAAAPRSHLDWLFESARYCGHKPPKH